MVSADRVVLAALAVREDLAAPAAQGGLAVQVVPVDLVLVVPVDWCLED